MKKNKKIDSLTGARFVAIMMIVLSHFEFLGQYGIFGEIYIRFLHMPTLGVDYFFMLSGFGMMLSKIRKDGLGKEELLLKRKELLKYGIEHIKKIYPTYIATLLLGGIYYVISAKVLYGSSIINAMIKAVWYFIIDITLLQSATGLKEYSHSLNGVCWFLSTMFCIYIISPCIMKIISKYINTMKKSIILLGMMITISMFSAFLLNYVEKNTVFDDLCYGSPYRRVFYVISGMIVAIIYFYCSDMDSKTSIILNEKFEYISVAISIIWTLTRYSLSETIGILCYGIDMVCAASILLSFALCKGNVSRSLASRRMVLLGNISLYVFIWHYVIRWIIDSLLYALPYKTLLFGLFEAGIIITLTFIISFVSYRLNNNLG